MRRVLLAILLLTGGACLRAGEPLANWRADFPDCQKHRELLKSGPMDIGVRFATSNARLVEEFRGALDFWAGVVELKWHEEDSDACAVQVLDGQRDLFQPAPDNLAARSQFPDRPEFHGWIAFNPAVKLGPSELFRIAVHEIGHMLGLEHSNHSSSVMYGIDVDGPQYLDAGDLAALAERHQLRAGIPASKLLCTNRKSEN
jgi:hypothetical protein